MGDSKHDQLESTLHLQGNVKLRLVMAESDAKTTHHFEIEEKHMMTAIPAPLTAKETKGCSFTDIMEIFEKTSFSKDAFSLWRGYYEGLLFQCKEDVRSKLSSYAPYLKSSQCPQDIMNMMNCIAYEMKHNPDKYDAVGILMALAQNGGVCSVQRGIGIRAVYAAMIDSMMDHMKHNSVETKVLSLLRKCRFVLAEQVAMDMARKLGWYSGNVLNSHLVVPVQNKLAPRIGIDVVPDEHASAVPESEDSLYSAFMEKYTVEHVVRVVLGAVNDSHRLINYHDFVEHLESIKPAEVDKYVYLNDFVFDMDSGKFSEMAVKYLLWEMGVIRPEVGFEEKLMRMRNHQQQQQKKKDNTRQSKKSKGKSRKHHRRNERRDLEHEQHGVHKSNSISLCVVHVLVGCVLMAIVLLAVPSLAE
eukprot:TRINITY_DN1357_c0_g1_i1.p1 TRINITY_DN1357_c0_g1~~TRINITY_DN1357_c0_g1_i1.p1  ORF type:complete len:416 (+),score=105.79 TRINITY_DN1357_c0_g1_i1:62-1309(+)